MIKLLIFDFDGVFTNGQIHFDSIGNITKFYNVKDGYGIKLLKENNIEVGIISGFKENDSQRRILEHLKIKYISLGNNNKFDILQNWCDQLDIDIETEVGYMGDDINDLEIMKHVYISGCPKDAIDKVKEVSDFVSTKNGGDGCVREFCDFILKKPKKQMIYGLICVKYNSTRLPFKNFRKFGNTTLLDIKVKKLLSLNFLEKVIVNTESDYIINYLSKYNNNKLEIIKRDIYYSSDLVENIDFCRNVVECLNCDIVLYSPVTMPFIETSTYESMYDIYLNNENNYDSIILSADGIQGSGHTYENHKLCFGASLMSKENIIKYGDFIGENPYYKITKCKERIDIDYPHEFNLALYHYYNTDSIYGSENNNSMKVNTLYDLNNMSPIEEFEIDPTENKTKNVKIIDVTIRDGGFDNNWKWSKDEVKEMLKCAGDTGIEFFEIGYICNKDIVKSSDGMFRNVPIDVINEIVNEIKPKCKISVLFDAWRYDTNQLLPKESTKIDLIRVVTYIEDEKLLYAIEQCKKVKNKGYQVSLNIMCASYFNTENLENIKKRIIENINVFDYVYFADSYGSLEPDGVNNIFMFIKTIKNINNNIKIGFHIHNNGQIGMANMIASLQHVDIFDASYYGMGRGMGNIRLEDMVLFLIIKKKYNLNIEYFLNYLDKKINKVTKYEIKNTIIGLLNIHPYRLRDYDDNIPLYELYKSLKNLPFEKKYNYLKV